MASVMWGYSAGYQSPLAIEQRLSDVETNQQAQQTALATLNASVVVAHRVSAIGSLGATVVAAGATVRLSLPTIGEAEPNDGRWNRLGTGVIAYDGSISGVYEVHCPVSFGTTLATLTAYTFAVNEGTDLATAPVIRDSVAFAVERQLATAGNGTANPTGLLTLQPTGGEISLTVAHSALASLSVTPTTIELLMTRVSAAP